MNNSVESFSDLTAKDLRPWLDLPVSRLLLSHLRSERDRGKDAITDYVFANEDANVRLAAAGVRIYDSLLALMEPMDTVGLELEEPFVDPGAIPPPPGADR